MVQACLVLGCDAVVWTADQEDYDISDDLEFNKADWLKVYVNLSLSILSKQND